MKSYEQYCGLAQAIDRVGERWSLLIVRELLVGPRRFSELAQRLPGIASNLLTARLKALEEDSVVAREVLPSPANVSVYLLTPSGAQLREAVEALTRWGGRFMLTRSPKQRFDVEWLAVSLNALRLPLEPGQALRFEVEMPEGAARFVLDDVGVRLAPADGVPPEVRVRTQAQVLLGLVAGALDLRTVGPALELTGATRATRRFRTWLAGPRRAG
jgi:DNA-binding HxlR family transcriptional regulator